MGLRSAWVVGGFVLASCGALWCQVVERPLPAVAGLIEQVDKRQQADEALARDYIFHQSVRTEELDGHGKLKKSEVSESDVFWIDGVRVSRVVRKNGRDLTSEELKKEDERIDKAVAKAKNRRAKADQKGAETDSEGHEEIPASRILELGQFSNERRVSLDGRDTIAVDFVGDPKARTRNRSESFLRDAAGTVWIDEQDQRMSQVQAHVVKDFKVGGGLIADLQKDSAISLQLRKINGEVWLPVTFEGHGRVRVLLFGGFSGNVRVAFSDFRKFKATSTIVPVESAEPKLKATEPQAGQQP